MANNKLKYWRVEAAQRDRLRCEWNRPAYWPLVIEMILLLVFGWRVWQVLQKREQAS